MKEGNYSTAITVLRRAAEQMYTLTTAVDQATVAALPNANATGAQHEGFCEHCSHSMRSPENSLGASSKASLFMQDKPFCITPLQHITKKQHTFVSTTILYNMALAYHLAATQCAPIPKAFQCASVLYRMACSLALKNVQSDDNMAPIAMGCMNNLGCLYYDTGEFDQARLCLDDLAKFIASVGKSSSVPLLQRNEFMLNTMLFRNLHGAPAA